MGNWGSCLRELAPSLEHEFVFTDVAELDITSSDAVAEMFEDVQPDWVVNCAACTAVDKAETDVDLALKNRNRSRVRSVG